MALLEVLASASSSRPSPLAVTVGRGVAATAVATGAAAEGLQARRIHFDPLVVTSVPACEVDEHLRSLHIDLQHLGLPPLVAQMVLGLDLGALLEVDSAPPAAAPASSGRC